MRLLLLLITLPLCSISLDRISLEDTTYRIEDNRSIRDGFAPYFFSRPVSYREYGIKSDDKGMKLLFGVSLRAFYNSDNKDFIGDYYWYNRWVEMKPLFNIGFLAGDDNFLLRIDFDLRADYAVKFSNSFLNLPYGELWYQEFDFNFPTRGFIVAGIGKGEFIIGRDKIHFGPGQKGGLFLSRESSFFNQILFTYRNQWFKGSFYTMPMESYLSGSEKSDLEYFLNPENGLSSLWRSNFPKDIGEQSKILTGHRFEFRPLDNLLISFNDALMLGGRVANFEDMMPNMFFHNIFGENYSNVMIGFDTFWVPVKGLGIYGEVVIDDIRNSHEDEISVPTSMGFLAGGRYSFGDFSTSLEWVKIDPFTYLRWSPLQSFFNRRKYFSIRGKLRYMDTPVGFFLGPGSQFFSFWVDMDKKNISLSLGWELWELPDRSFYKPQELIEAYRDESLISKELYNSLYLNGEYTVNSWLSLKFNFRFFLLEDVEPFLSLALTYKHG